MGTPEDLRQIAVAERPWEFVSCTGLESCPAEAEPCEGGGTVRWYLSNTGAWGSYCARPLPEPVGDVVVLRINEDEEFISSTGRQVVRFHPEEIVVGTRIDNGYGVDPVLRIEDQGFGGLWSVFACDTHEYFRQFGYVNGYIGASYAWRDDDGRFRVSTDAARPAGPC